MNLKNKRILITGGEGFLGGYVVEEIKKRKPKKIIVPKHADYDLRDRAVCEKLTRNVDAVIHLAAQIGGIGFIDSIPGEIFYNNAVMGIELMEAARKNGVKKFVSIGTVCEYPRITPLPFKEKYLWDGYPEETTAPYGWAKKILIVQGKAYKKQYRFDSIHLLPVNLYGPKDNFDKKLSHVIPALIKRIVEARERGDKTVTVWGSGKATREFLYVEDAAKGIVLAAEKYDEVVPINLGTGSEVPIKTLADKIVRLTKYKGSIVWDKTKPDGQPRRKLDVSKGKLFGFKAQINIEEGLKRTIEWYEKNH
jgi:GDP-L-fucose synthase